jgi:uncharacterized protein (TIGR03437 family)
MEKLLSLLLVCAPSLLAGDPARDLKWQQDLDFIATQLPMRHPNLFFQTPRAIFDGAVSDLRAAIPDLTDVEVMVKLAAIVALPGDAHTNLYLTQANAHLRPLPIRVIWMTDGLFVTAVGKDYARALGARIVQIGDQPVDLAYKTVSSVISHENDPLVRAISPSYLTNADILQALKIAPDNASVHFVFEDLAGSRFSADIASLELGKSVPGLFAPDSISGFTALAQQHLDQNYWFTYLAGSKTIYFAYNSCIAMANLPFATFNDQLWAAFDANPVERIVIDLRNNGGGSDILINPFFVSETQRASQLKSVQQYVIVGRKTFSASIDDSVRLKQAGMTFIGEPTGGSVNHYGNEGQMMLPNSLLVVGYSLQHFTFPGFPEGSLIPDINIPLYSADYFARHDPFLAAALAGSSSSATSPAKGDLTIVNSASLRPSIPVAPGSLATMFGNLPGITAGSFSSVPFPSAINGVEVLVNGGGTHLLAVGPSQINFQVPAGIEPGTVPVQVRWNGAQIAEGTLQVAATGPGIFVAAPFNLARPGVVLDQTLNLITDVLPAKQGSTIRIYATGQGPGSDVRVFIGSDAAEVVSSAPDPVIPGIWQVTARIPQSDSAIGQMPVFVISGTNVSNGVTIGVGK